jgi:hypothetical protein
MLKLHLNLTLVFYFEIKNSCAVILKVKKEINLIAIELRFTFERIAIIKIKCYEFEF